MAADEDLREDRSADRLKVLTSVPHEPLAAVIVAALHSAGIQAAASGVLTAGFRAEGPGWVRILVRESDLHRAQQELAELKANAASVDDGTPPENGSSGRVAAE